MAYFCSNCGTELLLAAHGSVPRTESCTKCLADLHACLNCIFYDRSAYNECRESQADRVVDKKKSNFCDYFKFREGKGSAQNDGKDALKKLDDLFK